MNLSKALATIMIMILTVLAPAVLRAADAEIPEFGSCLVDPPKKKIESKTCTTALLPLLNNNVCGGYLNPKIDVTGDMVEPLGSFTTELECGDSDLGWMGQPASKEAVMLAEAMAMIAQNCFENEELSPADHHFKDFFKNGEIFKYNDLVLYEEAKSARYSENTAKGSTNLLGKPSHDENDEIKGIFANLDSGPDAEHHFKVTTKQKGFYSRHLETLTASFHDLYSLLPKQDQYKMTLYAEFLNDYISNEEVRKVYHPGSLVSFLKKGAKTFRNQYRDPDNLNLMTKRVPESCFPNEKAKANFYINRGPHDTREELARAGRTDDLARYDAGPRLSREERAAQLINARRFRKGIREAMLLYGPTPSFNAEQELLSPDTRNREGETYQGERLTPPGFGGSSR